MEQRNKSSPSSVVQTYCRPYAKLGHCKPELKYYLHKTSLHFYFLSRKQEQKKYTDCCGFRGNFLGGAGITDLNEFLYMSLKWAAGQSLDNRGTGRVEDGVGVGGARQRQKESGVHWRRAVASVGPHHMGRMLNTELWILTYFHQTDTEIHREAVLCY